MRFRYALIAAGIVLPFTFSLNSYAQDDSQLATEVETPDVLIQDTDEKKKKQRYGDKDIKLSPDGRKDNAQITPDPLEKLLTPKEKLDAEDRQKLEKHLQKKKAVKATTEKPSKAKKPSANDEILTPDPLLDILN